MKSNEAPLLIVYMFSLNVISVSQVLFSSSLCLLVLHENLFNFPQRRPHSVGVYSILSDGEARLSYPAGTSEALRYTAGD